MVGSKVTRAKAFFSHLGLGLLLFLMLLYCVVWHWYPGFFFQTDGGSNALLTLSLCTMLIGPLLTLCLFKPKKTGLRTDVLLITLLYLAINIIATWFIYQSRPIALVFSAPRFYSLTQNHYAEAGLAVPDLKHLPGPSPKKIFIAHETASQASRAKQSAQNTPLHLDASLYQPLAPHWPDVLRQGGRTIASVIENRSHGKAEIALWLHRHDKQTEQIRLLPVFAGDATRYFYVDISSPSILGVTSDIIHQGG